MGSTTQISFCRWPRGLPQAVQRELGELQHSGDARACVGLRAWPGGCGGAGAQVTAQGTCHNGGAAFKAAAGSAAAVWPEPLAR